MNTELTFKVNSDLDIKLMDLRFLHGPAASSLSWPDFLYQLDPNITNVDYRYDNSGYTTLTFTNESYKTWFILRWT